MKDRPEDSAEWHWGHNVLLAELHMKPWQFPCVRRPDPTKPSAHDPALPWDDGAAENLYRELAAALQQERASCRPLTKRLSPNAVGEGR